MAQWRNAKGQLDNPVVYFECEKEFFNGTRVVNKGYLIIAPDSSHPTPYGYVRKECKYLHEVDVLTRRMNSQDKEQFDMLMAKDREIMRERREQNRAKLRRRMLAPDCSPFEKRFILGALEYLDKKEKEATEFHIRGYFHAREFDSKSTDPIDKHGKQVQAPRMSDRLAALLTK